MRKGKYQDQKQDSKVDFHLEFLFVYVFFCVGIFMIGCANSVGDACIADSQCGASQICDIRSFEGYCTVVDCEENTCPGGSVCVEFKNAQTYCMAICTQTDECREGYKCIEVEDETLGESIGYCGQ